MLVVNPHHPPFVTGLDLPAAPDPHPKSLSARPGCINLQLRRIYFQDECLAGKYNSGPETKNNLIAGWEPCWRHLSSPCRLCSSQLLLSPCTQATTWARIPTSSSSSSSSSLWVAGNLWAGRLGSLTTWAAARHPILIDWSPDLVDPPVQDPPGHSGSCNTMMESQIGCYYVIFFRQPPTAGQSSQSQPPAERRTFITVLLAAEVFIILLFLYSHLLPLS